MSTSHIVSVETEVLPDSSNPQLLVHVTDDSGQVGTGETWWGTYQLHADPGGPVQPIASMIGNVLAPACIGWDVSDVTGLWQHLFRLSYQYGPEGIVSSAIGGIDLALWDLAGRRAGQTTASLLGPAQRQAVPAYASLHWLGDADRAVADARRAVKAGFRAVKLHEARADIVKAVREGVGPDIELMLDVSARLDEAQTLELASACANTDLTWIEEPIFPQQDHETMARIREAISIPLAAGENEFSVAGFDRLMRSGAVDVVQPDPAKCGGLTPSLIIAERATANRLDLCPHNFSLGPSLGANIHLAMVAATARWVEVPFLPDGQRFPGDWRLPTLINGMIPYPSNPGLAWD